VTARLVSRTRWRAIVAASVSALTAWAGGAPAVGAEASSVVAGKSTGGAAENPLAVQVPPFQRRVLPNGIVLVLMPKRDVPLTAFTAVLRGGALADPPARPGVASLTASLLEKGAGRRDAFAFADTVADVGGTFGAGAGAESITVGGQFLSRDRELMIELLADALLRPRFAADEFATLRARQIELIKAAKDSEPQSLLRSYGRAFLFGEHPYASPVDGTERSLAALSLADVQQYYRAQFGADRLTLVFTGDIDAAALEKSVRRAFGGMARAPAALPPVPVAPRVEGRRVLLVDLPEASQTYFWIGNVGVARSFPQRAALDIVNTLYGGRFTSILNTELRIKSGLTYGASSAFNRATAPAEFAISSFTQTDNTGKAIDMVFETLAALRAGTIAPDTLQSARSYVLGQYPLRLETAANWAGTLADLEFFGLDRRWIEDYGPALTAVTPDDARLVISSAFPAPENVAVVMIGDAAKIRETARRYGPVTEVALVQEDLLPARR
jgi:zinc protease